MRFVYLAALPVLAACVPAEQSQPVAGNSPETCPASEYSALIGTNINAATLPLSVTYRTIWPGDLVTEDFVPDRMNVAVNNEGIVQGLTCG